MGTSFERPKQIYDCQQFVGEIFIDEIMQQMAVKPAPGDSELKISEGILNQSLIQDLGNRGAALLPKIKKINM